MHEPCGTISVQQRVQAFAAVTQDIATNMKASDRHPRQVSSLLDHVGSENSFKVVGIESALDHQSLLSIQGASCSQFKYHKLHNMFQISVESFAQFSKVPEHCFLCPFTDDLQISSTTYVLKPGLHLWSLHADAFPFACQLWIVLMKDTIHTLYTKSGIRDS